MDGNLLQQPKRQKSGSAPAWEQRPPPIVSRSDSSSPDETSGASSSSAGLLSFSSAASPLTPDGRGNIILYLHLPGKPNQIDDLMKSSPADKLFKGQGWETKLIDEDMLRSEFLIIEEHSMSDTDFCRSSNDPSPRVSSDSEEAFARSSDERDSPEGAEIRSAIDELGSGGGSGGGLIRISGKRRKQWSSDENEEEDKSASGNKRTKREVEIEPDKKRNNSTSEESDGEEEEVTPKKGSIIAPIPKRIKNININVDLDAMLLRRNDAKRKREDDPIPVQKEDKGKGKAIAVPSSKRHKATGSLNWKGGLPRSTTGLLASSANENMSDDDSSSSSDSAYIETSTINMQALSKIRAIVTLETVIAYSSNLVAFREMLTALMQAGVIVIVLVGGNHTNRNTNLVMNNFFITAGVSWQRTHSDSQRYKYNRSHHYPLRFQKAASFRYSPWVIAMQMKHATLTKVPLGEALFRAIDGWIEPPEDLSAVAFAEVGDGYLGYFSPMQEMDEDDFMWMFAAMVGADVKGSEKRRYEEYMAKKLHQNEESEDDGEEEVEGEPSGGNGSHHLTDKAKEVMEE